MISRFELIPLEELEGRPRVDVLCNMSGIFRDSFQNVVELLDDLFQRAAAAAEPQDLNFIRRALAPSVILTQACHTMQSVDEHPRLTWTAISKEYLLTDQEPCPVPRGCRYWYERQRASRVLRKGR